MHASSSIYFAVSTVRPWMNKADPPSTRAKALVAEMTLTEKVAMLHGPAEGPCCQCTTSSTCAYVGNVVPNERLGIPPINMNDGPQGFRDNNNPQTTTAWPSGLTMAASWDVKGMEEWGVGMGKEFIAKGILKYFYFSTFRYFVLGNIGVGALRPDESKERESVSREIGREKRDTAVTNLFFLCRSQFKITYYTDAPYYYYPIPYDTQVPTYSLVLDCVWHVFLAMVATLSI